MANQGNATPTRVGTDLLEYWVKLDQFILEQVDSLVEKMEATNKRMASRLEMLVKGNLDVDSAKQAVGEVFRISMERRDMTGIDRLLKELGNRKSLDKDLCALAGMVHYNMLLVKRFASFRNVLQILDLLYMNRSDSSKLRSTLGMYGIDLQHIWKHSYSRCESVSEREFFKKAQIVGK